MKPLRSAVIETQLSAHWTIAPLGYGIANFRDRPGIQTVRQIARHRKLLLTTTEAMQLYEAARSTRIIAGEVAEVGTFMGASARILTEALPDKTVHVCDTFEGLPHGEDFMHAGDFSGPIEKVKDYLAGRRVAFHRGLFPRDTGREIAGERFCFVHLDATFESLRFFWPRMTPGGIIISHDHPIIPGVVRAFEAFTQENPVPVIQLSGNQAMMVKF